MYKPRSAFATEVRTAMRGGDGSVKIEHIWKKGEEMGSPTRMYSRLILQPGCSIGWHVHENEEEIFYIVAGQARIDDNGTEVVASAGDSIITRAVFGLKSFSIPSPMSGSKNSTSTPKRARICSANSRVGP